MSISYDFLDRAAARQDSAAGPGTGVDRAANEYAVIDQLLSTMAAEMGASMQEIQSINNMMRMIAMNSSIEAARAGAAGRAFAVVSGEMKTLSDKTGAVAKKLRSETGKTIEEVRTISEELATNVRGTRLSDLALTNIDLIDRNLYERSCDVRWWATDSSLVEALDTGSTRARQYACERLGVILAAYTVYFDLVLCDADGVVVANGRPSSYSSQGRNLSGEAWFSRAMNSHSGDDYGFQTVHPSDLVAGERVLVYSCAVREGGRSDGEALGALGILFNYDSLAQVIMRNTPVDASLRDSTRVCVTDDTGLVLADSRDRILEEKLDFPGRADLYRQAKGYEIVDVEGWPHCVAHARAPGYETYSTGWHSLILQAL